MDVGGKYRVALDSDAKDLEFDGHGRLDHNVDHFTTQGDWDGRSHSLMVYISLVPRRSGGGAKEKESFAPSPERLGTRLGLYPLMIKSSTGIL